LERGEQVGIAAHPLLLGVLDERGFGPFRRSFSLVFSLAHSRQGPAREPSSPVVPLLMSFKESLSHRFGKRMRIKPPFAVLVHVPGITQFPLVGQDVSVRILSQNLAHRAADSPMGLGFVGLLGL